MISPASLAVMLKTSHYGTYHFANSGKITRSGYLQTFLKAIDMDPDWMTASYHPRDGPSGKTLPPYFPQELAA